MKTYKVEDASDSLSYAESENNNNLDLAPGKSLIATGNDDTATSLPTFRSYNQRWCLAAAVFCVVGSNYAHRLSFAAVNSKAAAFYETSYQSMKYIIAISTLSSILSCVSAPLLVSIYGLRFGVHIGAVLTCFGNFLCWLSTFPIFTTAVPDSNVWYWLTMTGQFFSGLGVPFVSCLTTKISHHWFQDRQRIWATTLLSLACPVGIVLGQAITPLIVPDESKIPLMNMTWFFTSLVGLVLTIFTVRSSYPPSPPSSSAEKSRESAKGIPFFKSVRLLVKSATAWLLIFTVGGAMAYITGLETASEGVMCSLGYSNTTSGLCAALVFIGGFAGSIVIGFTGKYIQPKIVVKICSGLMVLILVGQIFVMQTRHFGWLFGLSYSSFGFFAIGSYPMILELVVETTYPADESIMLAAIAMSSALQGFFVIVMNHALSKPIDLQGQVESSCHDSTVPLNHENYIYLLNGYGMFLSVLFLLFKPKFNRTKANQIQPENSEATSYTENSQP